MQKNQDDISLGFRVNKDWNGKTEFPDLRSAVQYARCMCAVQVWKSLRSRKYKFRDKNFVDHDDLT